MRIRPLTLARPDSVNVADTVPRTEVEGPGVRFALWVQGCPMRCKGCCNPHLLEFRDAAWRSVDSVVEEIVETEDIEGVTFLGGEPFAQAEALARVADGVQAHGLTVMIFSGFTLEHLRSPKGPASADALLAHTDILVDGPYIASRASQTRRWIGSDNQRVHLLSERYAHLAGDDWPRGDHGMEIRLNADGISFNGHPREELIELVSSLRWATPTETRDATNGDAKARAEEHGSAAERDDGARRGGRAPDDTTVADAHPDRAATAPASARGGS